MLTLAPLTAPPEDGSNATVSVTDWPGCRVVPLETPLAEKPAPFTVTPEMTTLEFPLLVSVAVCDWLVWSGWLPKLRLAGLAPSK